MHDGWWILIALLIIGLGVLFDSQFKESFQTPSASCDTSDVDTIVTGIYKEILDRYPSRVELIENRRAILSGKRTFDDVRQRLMDSSEYAQKIKMQSNALTPELPKMISDSRLLRKLASIYKDERLKDCPPKMVLPLKDIYIKLDYNDQALRYMLRSAKWTNFEEDILLDPNFDVSQLDDLIDNTYGGTKQIIADSYNAQSQPSAADINSKVCRMIEDQDSDSTALLNKINSNAVTSGLSGSGSGSDGSGSGSGSGSDGSGSGSGTGSGIDVLVRPHYGDMVLRPEFAWSVPQPRPPVCTTLGKPMLVQPVVLESSTTLNATPLGDASDTGVGSIMPQFTYKEYIHLQ
jgi:uncharacterized membrane protein YgcG